MNDLPCPRCSKKEGYKFLLDGRQWFECVVCNFQCPMKIYRSEFKDKKDERRTK